MHGLVDMQYREFSRSLCHGVDTGEDNSVKLSWGKVSENASGSERKTAICLGLTALGAGARGTKEFGPENIRIASLYPNIFATERSDDI